mgnify:CR=1 FL=1
MQSKEILEFYHHHQSILQTIYENKADSDWGRFLIYIVDTPDENNIPFLAKIDSNITFENNEQLNNIFVAFFKSAPTTTPDGKKIVSIFQVHLILCQYRENTTFLATAEKIKTQGFFHK